MLLLIAVGALIAYFIGLSIRDSHTFTPPIPRPILTEGRYNITCLDDYPLIGSCSPPSTCGRIIVDSFLTPDEVSLLRSMSELGMAFGSGSGGPTIFDAVTGAASKGEAFIDAYQMMETRWTKLTQSATRTAVDPSSLIFTRQQLDLYRRTTQRIQERVSKEFGVSNLYLTQPSFFSRITAADAKTKHDEYWHEHVDKLQYGSFQYTALVYLSDYEKDFTGGEFVFVDGDDATSSRSYPRIQPSSGRLVSFTSGKENIHYVDRVRSGVRHTLTIAFTCDKKKGVEAKLFKKAEALIAKHEEWKQKNALPNSSQEKQDTSSLSEK